MGSSPSKPIYYDAVFDISNLRAVCDKNKGWTVKVQDDVKNRKWNGTVVGIVGRFNRYLSLGIDPNDPYTFSNS